MPTYTYSCDKCGTYDVQHPMNDMLTVCNKCKGLKIKKVYGTIGVQFKGSGFYSTDSKKK